MPEIVKKLVADSPLLMAAIDTNRAIISISRTWIEQGKLELEGLALSDLFDVATCDLIETNLADVFATSTFVQGLSVTCGTNPDTQGLLSI